MRLIEARDPETSSLGVPTVLLFSLASAHNTRMSSACVETAGISVRQPPKHAYTQSCTHMRQSPVLVVGLDQTLLTDKGLIDSFHNSTVIRCVGCAQPL